MKIYCNLSPMQMWICLDGPIIVTAFNRSELFRLGSFSGICRMSRGSLAICSRPRRKICREFEGSSILLLASEVCNIRGSKKVPIFCLWSEPGS